MPAPALALIAEYRRDPRPSAGAPGHDGEDGEGDRSGEDVTFGSQPAASGPHLAPARHRLRPGQRQERGGAAVAGGPGRRRRIVLAAWSAAAAVALIGAGTGIGFAVSDSRPLPPPPPPTTVVVPDSEASVSPQQAGRPQVALYQSQR